jgi:hypothetical protein
MHAETHSVKSQATEICWHILVQLPNIQFHELCLAVLNFLHVAHGWTDKHGKANTGIFASFHCKCTKHKKY